MTTGPYRGAPGRGVAAQPQIAVDSAVLEVAKPDHTVPSDCSCAEILVLFLDPVRHLMFEALLLPRLLTARNVLKEAVAKAGSGQLDVKAAGIYER